MATAQLDFGYPWWLSYGHLVILAATIAVLFFGYRRRWPRWLLAVFGLTAVWAGAAFLLIRFGLDVNSQAALPTQDFLRSGEGRVLDLGAGTGRSSIMVLSSRPKATLVALDLFADSFDMHFGRGETPQRRLLANLRVAGVEQRASLETGDMRKLPFESASFEAIVSCYAVDHLTREGVGQTLAESARVLKPGGQFLLMVVQNDRWVKFAFGPLLSHGGARGEAWWTSRVKEAGFTVVEAGVRPATLYLLLKLPQPRS